MRFIALCGLLAALLLVTTPVHAQQWAADTTANTLTTTAKVGIGTPTPGSGLLLHVLSPNQTISRIESTGNGGSILDLSTPIRQWFIMGDDSPDQLRFRDATSGVDRMVIDSNGHVGIGVVDPQVGLDIAGTIHARYNSNSNFYALQLRRGESSVTAPALFSETTNGTLIIAGDTYGNGTVTLSKKVGIGTTSPSAPLTVADADPAGIQVLTTDAGGTAAQLRRDSAMGLLELFDSDGATSGALLSPRPNTTSYILSNVGIGTYNPLGRLHVSADSRSNPVTISSVSPGLYFYDTELENGVRRYDSFVLEADANRFYIGSRDKNISNTPGTGIRHFTFHSEGRFGIGTTSPSARLHVHNGPLKVSSDTQWSDLFIDAHTGNEARLSFQSANTPQWQIGKSGDNTRLFFYSYALGDAVMRLHDTGNVGIGVTNPTRLLDVGGSGALIRKDLITGGSEDGQNGRIFVRNSAGDNAIQLAASASNVTYFNAGNVGIGTTTPESILNVVTNTVTDKISLTRNGHDQFYARADGVLGWGPASVQGILSWDTGESIIRAASGNALTFQTNGSTDRMIIDSSGNVGIGTNTPGYELDVAGTINATEILVDGQPLSATDSWDATNGDLHYTAGNVGIGTTNSSSKLTINQSNSDPTNEVLTLTNHLGNPNDAVSLRLNSGGGASGTFLKHLRQGSSGGDFAIFTAPTLTGASVERFRITKDGEVGIGTTDPNYALSVAGSLEGNNYRIGGAESSFIGKLGNNGSGIVELEAQGIRDIQVGGETGGTALYIDTSERRVGIGVTDPQVALDIAGTIHGRSDSGSNLYSLKLRRGESNLIYPALYSETSNGTLIIAGDANGNGTVALTNTVGIGTTTTSHQLTIAADANTNQRGILLTQNSGSITSEWKTSGGGGTGISSSDAFNIFTGGSAFPANSRLHITAGGNVGIGTTNPSSKLAVDGTITSKEVVVTVDQAAWPDYVFADDYTLRSLEEVEQFIDEKGHLPEVPSAEEVAEEGVAMGGMQSTLLKKIEELTLYLIDMKQEVDSLRAELKSVKSQTP